MKRAKVATLGLVASFLVAVGAAGAVNAVWSPNFQSSEKTVTLAKSETHEGSLYAAGDQVTINGTVTGSLYCAGATVTINGTVEGDMLCAGQKVVINGMVEQDVRVAGQFVEVDGVIGGSLSAFAQDVRFGIDSRVAEDVNGAAQQFTLEGVIGRDVAIGTQLFALNGEVRGNVDTGTEQLQLGDEASIAGNLNYSAIDELTLDDSKVAGEISFNPMPEHQTQDGGQVLSVARLMFSIMMAVSALAVVLVMPRFLNRSSALFSRNMSLTILLGFATVFGVPFLVGILFFSIVLAPIALALLAGWLALLCLSGIFFAYWIGSELLRSQQNAVVRMLGGSAILLVLYLIPYLNALAIFIAVVVGSGMIVTTLTNGYKRPSYAITAKKGK